MFPQKMAAVAVIWLDGKQMSPIRLLHNLTASERARSSKAAQALDAVGVSIFESRGQGKDDECKVED